MKRRLPRCMAAAVLGPILLWASAGSAQDATGQDRFLKGGFLGSGLLLEPLDIYNPVRTAFDYPLFDPWDVQFTNTTVFEWYDQFGDRNLSAYPFLGAEPYDEFDLTLSRRYSPYEYMRGQVAGVANASDYRNPNRTLVPERLNFQWQKGDAKLPYRLELGDFFGNFSNRTLQTSLKGGQVDFQPEFGGFLGSYFDFNSIQLVVGSGEPDWLKTTIDEDTYVGLSWLMEGERLGNWSLNWIFNHRDDDPLAGDVDRNQNVISIAGQKDFVFAKQNLSIEGEMAQFRGDHNASGVPLDDQGQVDNGFFVQLSGSTVIPLTYRIRAERYGDNFQPAGGNITPDRRVYEGHVAWRFDSGVELRGRGLAYRDNLEQVVVLDTETLGVSLSGQLFAGWANNPWIEGINGTIDAFSQRALSTNNVTDNHVRSLDMNFNRPLPRGWYGNIGFLIQDRNDFAAPEANSSTYQFTLGGDHAVTYRGWEGSVAPGVSMRWVTGPSSKQVDFFPTVSLNLAKGPHIFGANLGYSSQNSRIFGGTDVNQKTLDLNYAYTFGDHVLRLDGAYTARDEKNGGRSDSYKIGLAWTYNYNKPATTTRPESAAIRLPAAQTPLVAVPETAPGPGALILFSIAPGTGLEAAEKRLELSDIAGRQERKNLWVYETRLLSDIEQRQRLVIGHDGRSVRNAALIIEFNDVGVAESTQQTFERVRKNLLDTLGRPDSMLEKGVFSPTLGSDLRAGSFVRIMEWSAENGTVRFGIPRRLDNRVRMEVQYAPRFTPARENRWSIEAVK